MLGKSFKNNFETLRLHHNFRKFTFLKCENGKDWLYEPRICDLPPETNIDYL